MTVLLDAGECAALENDWNQGPLLVDDEWQLYRDVRLAALRDAPEAFIARFEDEASYDDDFWRERMSRATRVVAERGNELVGLVCL